MVGAARTGSLPAAVYFSPGPLFAGLSFVLPRRRMMLASVAQA